MQLTKRIHNREFNTYLAGSGEPLLFIHGFPLDHSMWHDQLTEFSKDYQVIAPDLRGFGASKSDDSQITMREFANDLAELLQVLEIQQPVHCCGLSMGGYIAWQLLQNHREELKSLILCDTKAAADSDEAKQTRLENAAKVIEEGPEFLAEAMASKLFSPVTIENNPDVVTQTQSVIKQTSPTSISAALLGMAERPDVSTMLPQIDLPTLIVVGEDDAITTSEEMQRIANTIPDAEFIEIENAGHISPLEQPKQVNSAIRSFLYKQR